MSDNMDIIIIGAGASGIVTAINAKNENNKVILLEKNDRIGKNCWQQATEGAIIPT